MSSAQVGSSSSRTGASLGQRAGDHQPLALAAAELAEQPVGELARAPAVEHVAAIARSWRLSTPKYATYGVRRAARSRTRSCRRGSAAPAARRPRAPPAVDRSAARASVPSTRIVPSYRRARRSPAAATTCRPVRPDQPEPLPRRDRSLNGANDRRAARSARSTSRSSMRAHRRHLPGAQQDDEERRTDERGDHADRRLGRIGQHPAGDVGEDQERRPEHERQRQQPAVARRRRPGG